MTEDERQSAMREWGQGEGEGAPKKEKKEKDKVNQKEKEKEKEKIKEEKVSHPIDYEHQSGQQDDVEIINSGEEQKELDIDGKYKDLVAQAQKEYENLELVRGVPVSQVSSWNLISIYRIS